MADCVYAVRPASSAVSRALTAAPTQAILVTADEVVVDVPFVETVVVTASTGSAAAKANTATENAIVFLFIIVKLLFPTFNFIYKIILPKFRK